MGQAKQRGTFEQRKSDAITLAKQRIAEREILRSKIRPAGKSRVNQLLVAALVMGAGGARR